MWTTWALFTFQLVAFIVMLVLMFQMYRVLRRDGARPESAPSLEAGQLRAGVNDLVQELRRAADQINGDITARAATLEKLIDQADQRLRVLDAAVARADSARAGAPRAASAAGRPAPRLAAERPVAPRPIAARLESPSAARVPAGEDSARTVAPVQAGSPAAASAYRQSARVASVAPEERPANEGMSVDGSSDSVKFQTVRRLAGQGMSAAEIARATQLGREEVELIMQLTGEARS